MDYFRAKRYLDALPDWEVGRPALGPIEDYLPRMRALLTRLGNPQTRFRSIIVGGTNGKGTVASLLAAILKAHGHKAGLYTSPHLHTQRERIRIDGEILSKEQWADAVSHLDDCTHDFGREALGSFSKFEALTGLAAHLFAQQGVKFGVFEVGLGGRYDATNAWDSELAVLTAVGLDHVDLLGNTLEEIAADKLHISRSGRTLVTTVAQTPEVMDLIRQTCVKQEVKLQIAGTEWPLGHLTGRPATYAENARLALEAAQGLVQCLDDEIAHQAVVAHHWPGRFEVAHEKPLVLLDGAHNPAAAEALAGELQRLSGERPVANTGNAWVLVVGAGTGHDASGILHALAPAAQRVLLTSSDHPRALAPSVLADLAPDGLAIEQVPASSQALKHALALAGPKGRVCVAGSLHLVARAREFFNLPGERDGITEDMALENLECVAEAGQQLGLICEWISDDGTRLKLSGGQRPLRFWRNKHPFNDYVEARLAEDKAYQYEDFAAAGLPVPDTLKLFNPLADARFDRYKTHATVAEIVEEVVARFEFPLLVKKCHSSLAQGVFLEHNATDLGQRLAALFANSGFLDNIALVQQYVAGPEYRVVASRDELLLAYRKESEAVGADGDLNPLHQATGRAVRVEDAALLAQMQQLTAQVAGVYSLGFYAIDLIHGADGFSIIEINPNPMCYAYNRDNGRRDFIRLYERLLTQFAL
ncbi:MAG: Mur ligase family protein [Gemmatimonadetes bacterium]|nr:Mur ligase family protein [Gemmatimonadota bacterium]